jgi:hypothetical protein
MSAGERGLALAQSNVADNTPAKSREADQAFIWPPE